MSDFLKEAIDELTEDEEERKQIIRNIFNDADAAAEGKIKSYSFEEIFDDEDKPLRDELQELGDKRIGPNTVPFQEVLEQEGFSVEEVNKIAEEIKFEE